MELIWQLTGQSQTPDFTAFDRGEPIGRVYQIEHGPDRGLWIWTMTAVQAGPNRSFPTSGRAVERAKAGRCVAEAYCTMVESSWKGRLKPDMAA